jgi:tetratricopeptide (TPR) repeat protein
MKQSVRLFTILFYTSTLFFLASNTAHASNNDGKQITNLDKTIHNLQKQWAIANYKTPEADLEKIFNQLTAKAEEAVKKYPENAELLIWNAIIVSSDAGKNGGLSALGKVKTAHKLLQKAETINPEALNGSIYTSLGSLYYQVPGWPIGFGDDKKAEKYLQKALSLNPNGIDPNYFYGDFLIEEGKYKEAKVYLSKALNAPARASRPLADEGRHGEIEAKLKTIKNK